MSNSIIPPGAQLDMFGAEPTAAAVAKPKNSKEGLRNGHLVANCGPAAFEYLLAYAIQHGLQAGPATRAGKAQHGQLVSLLIVKKKVVRACFAQDVRYDTKPKIRRLSAKRFVRLCNALAAKRKGVPNV